MANKALAFKARDVGRLVRAVRAEGINPTTVEVDTKTGKIKVTSGKPDVAGGGDLDKWLEEHREGSA